MLDFDVQRCTRLCATTQRELKPGELIYSALVPHGAEVKRIDFSTEGWKGPPENSLGWWQSRLPDPNVQRVSMAPNDVMLYYFEQLGEDPARQDVRYVLTLLMIRRRLLRLEQSETDAAGQEWMVLFCPRNENTYKVPVLDPPAARLVEIQQEIGQLLFTGGEKK